MKYLIILSISLLSTILAAQEVGDIPFLQTLGEATVYIEPDEALASVTIYHELENLQAAREENKRVTNRIIDILKRHGVDDKHIQTQYMQIGIRYPNHRAPRTAQNRIYTAQQSIRFCITDLDRYDAIISELVQEDIQSLSNTTWRTTDHADKALAARLAAIDKSRVQAEHMAQALGVTLGKPITVIDQPTNRANPGAYGQIDTRTDDIGSSEGFARGEIPVHSRVLISWRIL